MKIKGGTKIWQINDYEKANRVTNTKNLSTKIEVKIPFKMRATLRYLPLFV